jgi:hypothetical protein
MILVYRNQPVQDALKGQLCNPFLQMTEQYARGNQLNGFSEFHFRILFERVSGNDPLYDEVSSFVLEQTRKFFY